MKIEKRMLVTFFLLLVIITIPEISYAKSIYDVERDKWVGTADECTENAIKVGKAIIRNKYDYGGGRDVSSYGGEMDCSAFMHYIYNKGCGLLLVNNNPEHAGGGPNGEPAVTVETLTKHLETHNVIYILDFKRGDMVLYQKHVGIYLGGGFILHSSGTNEDPKGVNISHIHTSYWSPKYIGKVARVRGEGKGVTKNSGFTGYVGDGESVGGVVENNSEEIGSNRAKGLKSFIDTRYVNKTVGVQESDVVLGQDKVLFFSDISKKVYSWAVLIGVIGSYLLLLYTSTGIMVYLVISRRGVKKGDKITSFFVGDLQYSKENTIVIFKRWGWALVIVGMFLLGSYVDVMRYVYEFIGRIM